jgi:hypothetical protein
MKKTNNGKTILFEFPDESDEVLSKIELLSDSLYRKPDARDDLINLTKMSANIVWGKDPETEKKVLIADINDLKEMNNLWKKYKKQ